MTNYRPSGDRGLTINIKSKPEMISVDDKMLGDKQQMDSDKIVDDWDIPDRSHLWFRNRESDSSSDEEYSDDSSMENSFSMEQPGEYQEVKPLNELTQDDLWDGEDEGPQQLTIIPAITKFYKSNPDVQNKRKVKSEDDSEELLCEALSRSCKVPKLE